MIVMNGLEIPHMEHHSIDILTFQVSDNHHLIILHSCFGSNRNRSQYFEPEPEPESKLTVIFGMCMIFFTQILKLLGKVFMKTGYHIWTIAKKNL